ncbi:MAG TPA: hypothetical protein DEQ77_09955 [Candidatus Omnitrophica bacterium]|nr:hypothetical protein [Candidatus Omnitrophota bacterium]
MASEKVVFLMIFLSVAVLCIGGLNGYLPLQEDSCIYLSLAQSLSKGLGYTYTAGPVNAPANYYPPGYPAMISPLVSFFPRQYLASKILTVVLTLMLIGIILYSLEEMFKDTSTIFAVLLAFNSLIIFYSRQILTEIPYLLFSFCGIYCFTRYGQATRIVSRFLFLAAFFMAIAFYVRAIGIVLVIAALLYCVFRRKITQGITLAFLFFISVFPWIYHGTRASKNAYIAEFEHATGGLWDLLQRLTYNLAATVGKELPDLFFYPFLTALDSRSFVFIFKFSLGSAIAVVLIVGFIKKIRQKGVWFFDVYSVVYFCVYLTWTHHGARYLVPLLPFLLYYLFLGAHSLLKREFFIKGVICAIIFLNIAGSIHEIIRERNNPYQPAEISFIQAVDWIKKNVSSENIILSRRSNWIYVYTQGLRGVKLLRTTDTRAHYAYIMDTKVDYIVIDQNKIYRDDARDYLLPLVRDYPDNFEKVYASPMKPQTYVYKVIR